ncbi:hypothetical protein [Extensimonas perlucida]|nr:hypothetical protein [Extensimonas perlucida]
MTPSRPKFPQPAGEISASVFGLRVAGEPQKPASIIAAAPRIR